MFVVLSNGLAESNCCILDQREKHHDETGEEIYVDGFDVTDLRQGGVRVGHQRGHGQHCGHAQAHSGVIVFTIQPERDPRNDDDQEGGHVHLV